MMSGFPILDRLGALLTSPVNRRERRRRDAWKRAAVIGVVSAVGAVAWSGCGPGDELRYYCDATGCFECDAYGCSAVAPPAKTSCTGATSCPPGSVCTSAGCTTTCSDAVPCPKGEVCTSGLCAAPGTDPGPKKDCTTPVDCGDGKTCIAGACEACGGSAGPCPCTKPSDCSGGLQCVAGSCTSPANSCTYSSECGDGKICADGQCLASCEAAPCTTGFTCEKGVCQPGPTGGGCTSDTQCTQDAPQCVAGSCVQACTGDPECGAGKFCDQGACVLDTRPTPNCTDDTQCSGSGAPRKCLGGFCKYTCTTDPYCRTIDNRIGFCAKDLVCRNEAEAKAECLASAECTGGKVCIDNACK